jgi:hypothetical protein
MDQTKQSQQSEQERFWDAFRRCAEENRVPPDRFRYYVKWLKEFVNFLPEKRMSVLNRPGLSVKSPADR